MKTTSSEESKGLFNFRNLSNKKAEAFGVFNETKRFFKNLKGWDYLAIGLALVLGLAVFTDFFGETGQRFAETGRKFWGKVKKLGFWKILFLILLGLIVADRIVAGINRAKQQREKQEEKVQAEESEK